MNILITGSSGFVGTALLHHIKASGTHDTIFLLSSQEKDDFVSYHYERDETGYHFEIPSQIDTLIHLGAWTPKSSAEANDIENSFSNILYTKSLLGKIGRIKKLVFISTLDVYAPTSLAINEDSKIGPVSLYGSSKLYCEEMVRKWAIQNSVQCCILRLGHIYGAGEGQYKKLIPVLIQQALKNDSISIITDGQEKRSYLNIINCADVIWKSAHDDSEGIFNVVSSKAFRVIDIAEKIKELSASGSEIRIVGQILDARDYIFDNTKLVSQFHIKERSLEEGLREEIDYFRQGA